MLAATTDETCTRLGLPARGRLAPADAADAFHGERSAYLKAWAELEELVGEIHFPSGSRATPFGTQGTHAA